MNYQLAFRYLYDLSAIKQKRDDLKACIDLTAKTLRSVQFIGGFLTCIISLHASAYTSTWTSSDDSNWKYTITLSNASIKKISSLHLGSEIKPSAVPVQTQHCTNGESALYPGKLYSWCYFITSNPMTSFLDSMPFVHWFFMEQPSPINPYWSGSVLRVNGMIQYFGPDFSPTVLPGTFYQEGDQLTYFRIWNDDITWDAKQGGHIVYLSREKIEADMFGKKTTSQGTLKQRLEMTDPIMSGDACCDTGVFEHNISYEIKLERVPLLITLPSHVDMGEVPVGTDSEARLIPISISSNSRPVDITPGIANITYEEIKSLRPNTGNSTCDTTLSISNENGKINSGEMVDLYLFHSGISAKVTNTNGCKTGQYSAALNFTVAWQ